MVEGKIPKSALKSAAKLSRESRVPLDEILHDHCVKAEKIAEKRKSDSGKCRVLGVDKFDGEDWIHGEYDTPQEALRIAREKTEKAKSLASGHSIATVYYAYDSQGRYLGGDTWVGE